MLLVGADCVSCQLGNYEYDNYPVDDYGEET